MISKRIKWGIHPDTKKAATSGKAIETPQLPGQVIIPVRQHIGAPAIPIVKKGDCVKKGQLIAKTDAPVSSYIHASISGKVIEVGERPHPFPRFGFYPHMFVKIMTTKNHPCLLTSSQQNLDGSITHS